MKIYISGKITELKPSLIFGYVLCLLGFHDWEITKWGKYKDRKCKYLLEEGFNRTCERCDKEQTLKRPKEYHPCKYVWTDINENNKK